MTTKSLAAAILACLLTWATPLLAQGGPLGSEDDPAYVVVEGLAPADLLNVRATASPTGLLLNRLQNGVMLKSFGCTAVSGYDWCRVEGVNDPGVKGWTPRRYLLAAGTPPEAAQPAAGAEPAADVPETLPAETPPAPQGPTGMDEALAQAVKGAGESIAALAAGRPAEAPRLEEALRPLEAGSAAAATPVAAREPGPPPAIAPAASTAGEARGTGDAAAQSDAASTRQAPAPAAEEPSRQAASQPLLTVFPPAVLVLYGFPLVFLLAMAAIASFGSFAFTPPFERGETVA